MATVCCLSVTDVLWLSGAGKLFEEANEVAGQLACSTKSEPCTISHFPNWVYLHPNT